jgi:class 3 adenylate cyclase
MGDHPAETPYTFLFTDIEGSTRLWEAHGDAMPEALREHLALLGRAIGDAGGTVVKETGDGVFAVFAVASQAVDAAVSAQLALTNAERGPDGPLRARMAIHTGPAIRDHDDYHGTHVNRSARLMAIAHGGQIVASESTYVLVREVAPADVSFVGLGEHRLKDLARPEHVRQVAHPALAADFPPLRSLGTFPNNLPAQLSTFVGRADAIAAVEDRLTRSRLVTLTGAGGAGKTRLALQVAANRVDAHPDGVWLVDLSGLTDPALLEMTVLAALHAPELPGQSPIEALTSYLARRDLLVVLDNCEHLIEAAAALVDSLLRAVPGIRFIATSREPLNVPGESTWRVPSLSLPERSGDDATESEAVALFVERAQAADPSFHLTPELRPVVARIWSSPIASRTASRS